MAAIIDTKLVPPAPAAVSLVSALEQVICSQTVKIDF